MDNRVYTTEKRVLTPRHNDGHVLGLRAIVVPQEITSQVRSGACNKPRAPVLLIRYREQVGRGGCELSIGPDINTLIYARHNHSWCHFHWTRSFMLAR